MKKHVFKERSIPAYRKIYEILKKDITRGDYIYGSKMPSKRSLCERMGVSVITIEHAYLLLAEEGYIESKERSGYYVIYKDSDFQSINNIHNEEIFTKSSLHTSNSLFPFTVMAKTMRKILQEQGNKILVKSPNHGCSELRVAISSYLARAQSVYAEPSQIIIGSGAEYLYSLIAQFFFDRLFAIETPGYDKISRVYTACGLKYEKLKLSTNGILTNELAKTKATVLHTTPFNSFPSGISANVSKRMEYINWAEECNGYIIEDNYDSELTVSKKNDDTVFSLCKSDRVIYLNTFSKTVAPSVRVGYMVLPKSLLDEFNRKLGFYSCTVPVFEQLVLAVLINSGDFERHINRIRRIKRKQLK